MTDGTEIQAPVVVSGAGVFNTFERLLPAAAVRRSGYHKLTKKVEPSIAHLGVYIGIRESAAQLGLPRTNFWIYPSEDHQHNLAAFAADHEAPFPAVYISFPSAKDPSWESRYPNTATIEIVAPANWQTFEKWKDKPWALLFALVVLSPGAVLATEPASDRPEPEKAQRPGPMEEIRVTGYHISRLDYDGPTPVDIFDRELLQSSGASTLNDFLSRLTYNTQTANSLVRDKWLPVRRCL